VTVIDALNRQPVGELREQLLGICGSRRWAERVAERRPFPDAASLGVAGQAALDELSDEDWREALSAEPEPEVAGSDAGTDAAAETAVRLYRQHFGYPFVAASPRMGADELLMRVRIRLGHDAESELRSAAAELRRVVRARLDRWLEQQSGAQPA
jgi:2-oxo-4-hydroxy-4-carboxy-5-ureidoimidazoline decarboxylase